MTSRLSDHLQILSRFSNALHRMLALQSHTSARPSHASHLHPVLVESRTWHKRSPACPSLLQTSPKILQSLPSTMSSQLRLATHPAVGQTSQTTSSLLLSPVLSLCLRCVSLQSTQACLLYWSQFRRLRPWIYCTTIGADISHVYYLILVQNNTSERSGQYCLRCGSRDKV